MALSAPDFLFDWDHRRKLLVPLVGGQPVFDRAGVAFAKQPEPHYLSLGVDTPRFEPDGLRLELSETNLLPSGKVFDFSGWTFSSVTREDAKSIYDGETASKLTVMGGGRHIAESLSGTTTSGDAEEISIVVERGTADDLFIGVWSTTNLDWFARYKWDWPTLSFSLVNNGRSSNETTVAVELARKGPNGGQLYLLTLAYNPTVTGASREARFFPDGGGGTGYCFLHSVQPVTDEVTTSHVDGTRATETFYWESAPPPQDMVIYVRLKCLMRKDGELSFPRIFQIGNAASSPRLLMYFTSNNVVLIMDNNVDLPASKAIAFGSSPGDLAELVGILNSDGSIRFVVRLNGGAVSAAAAAAPASGLPSAWAGNGDFALNSLNNGSNKGANLFQAVKIVTQDNVDSALDGTGTGDEDIMAEMAGAYLYRQADGTLAVSNTV